jgi:uncharacterized membrane protein
VDECKAANPCEHNGKCTNSAGSYSCDCSGTGYSGLTCTGDVDECNPTNPCQHNGKCSNTTGGFKCDCSGTGWEGTTCQTDVKECTTANPCKNGGKCSDTPAGSFTCDCTGTGYTGMTCQTDINECSPTNPCQNGAGCTNTGGSYTCACGTRFIGKTCEYQKFRGTGVLAGDAVGLLDDISADGTVAVGTSTSANGVGHAVRFIINSGTLQYLETPLAARNCSATATSTDGSVTVGTCYDANGNGRAFQYTPGDGLTYLDMTPLAAGTATRVFAMTPDARFVVGDTSPEAPYEGFRRGPSGTIRLGHMVADANSRANGISSDGTIIVGDELQSPSVPWKWTQAGGFQALSLHSNWAIAGANAISRNGRVIVGWGTLDWSSINAARWVDGVPSDDGLGERSAVNADGSLTGGAVNGVAFLWTGATAQTVTARIGTTSDLNGWMLQSVTGISDDGKTICGSGSHNGSQEGWVARLAL